MIELIAIGVIGLLIIAGAAVLGRRLGIAAPLILLIVGIAVSLAPVPNVTIDPEWILQGLLPPLLYASAVVMPTMSFRRDFRAIGGLSVLLVLLSSLSVGLLFVWLIPGLGFVWGAALGAVISPTDAVATSIIKGGRVPSRVVVILDGESLLNDATALVLLRTAIVSAAVGFSFLGALGSFAWSVVVALVVGAVIGVLNLELRRRVPSATVNTIVSFTVPFLASVPAELLGGSGLVAAVVAGLVTGYRGPRVLSPQHRLSDNQNWATLRLVAEGVVFLTMGLQLSTVLEAVERDHIGLPAAVGVAALALVVILLVRAAYVVPLLGTLRRRSRRGRAMQPKLVAFEKRLNSRQAESDGAESDGAESDGAESDGPARSDDAADPAKDAAAARGFRPAGTPELGPGDAGRQDSAAPRPDPRTINRLSTRARRALADIDYLLREPLGTREGFLVVWAGMRGAVTVAAAQTLPADTPQRPLLIFIAFTVATLSLLIQGSTVGPLAERLFPATADEGATLAANVDRNRVAALLGAVAEGLPRAPGDSVDQHRIAILNAQRDALLDARDDGTLDADALAAALREVDAAQAALELRDDPDS